jgi:hypothetical protein
MSELKYEIRVDAGQADAELRRVHTSATTLAGAEREVDRAVSQSNAALRQQGPAAKQAATGMQALQQQAKQASAVLGKQAAAIAILSQNIGEANGSVGKLVQGAGQMAAAFGAGGPLAAALVGGMALVGQLTKHLDETTAARDRAFDEKWRQIDEYSERVNTLRKRVQELNKVLDPAQEFLDAQQRAINIQERIDKLKEELSVRSKLTTEERKGIRDRIMLLENERKANEALVDAGISREREKIDAAETAKKSAEAEERRAKALERAKDARAEELQMAREFARSWNYDSLDEDDQRIAQENKARQEEKARITEENQRMEDEAAKRRQLIYLNALKDEEDAKKESKRRIEADNKRHLEEIAAQNQAYAMQATAIVAGASQQLISDLISGQEQALERFGLSIMAQAGQALVSYGIQALGAAAFSATTGNLPMAAQQAATGAGLVAAGVGLGGVSAGLGNLMGGGGGQREQRLPGSMAAPQQTGNGGGTVIQITYAGASGPTADQGGRAVVEGLARAQRRQEAAGPVSR